MDYRASGVDRDLADQFIENLSQKIETTRRPEIESRLGDFGGFFRAPSHLKDPLWVATTDGVGTKLLLAETLNHYQGLGQDLVGMCVNDLLCCRAEPLVFLDYIATGKLEPKALQAFMESLVAACRESRVSLIGGETAEMPGFYSPGRFDVAGFSVGVLERAHRFNPDNVAIGDQIFGFASSGFHSNGYSLVRRVIENQGWKLDAVLEGSVVGDYLLKPTELYVKRILALFETAQIKAASHITGGGLIENLPRGVVESRVSLKLKRSSIPTSPLMKRFVEAAKLEEREAFSTWNMGVGFCVIAPAEAASEIQKQGGFCIGEVIPKANVGVVLE